MLVGTLARIDESAKAQAGKGVCTGITPSDPAVQRAIVFADYENLMKCEKSARKYVLSFCWKNHQRFCPRCRHRKLYRLSDGRRRCQRCRYPFHDFSGRWINQGNLSSTQWLRLIKNFALELSTREMSSRVGLAYNTTYKAVTTLRLAITARSADAGMILNRIVVHGKGNGQVLAQQTWEPEEQTDAKNPVFGIKEQNGWVAIDLIPSVKAHILYYLSVKKVRKGNIVYTDQFADYDALLFCGDPRLDENCKCLSRGRVHIDCSNGFWCYAKKKLTKHRGISAERFPLYLKELEFRYNNRNQDIFPTLVEYLCDFVPERA
jgi:transposase